MVKKHLLLSRASCGSTIASGGPEGPSSEHVQCAPSFEGLSGPPEAIVRPQAVIHRVLKKNLIPSRAACGRTTCSEGPEGPSSEGAHLAPSLEGPSRPPEAVVLPQAARESHK